MAKAQKSRTRRQAKQQDRAKLKPQDCTLGLSIVHPKAAGIDVGNDEHWVAIPPALDCEPVRSFGCFTQDLQDMADWLVERGVDTVAMQSTGVYWIPLYDILSERGIRVFLVNPADTKNLPGRKTDIQECQWLLKMHVYGLLKNSFRPAEEILVMRAYWRQREQHISDASRCIQRMQKALTQMNVQLANVISDISGQTGQAIISAILHGERDPKKLARLRDPRIKASEERADWPGDYQRDIAWGTGPQKAGATARSAHQGQRRGGGQKSGGQLASGSSVHTQTGTGQLRDVPKEDRGVRPAVGPALSDAGVESGPEPPGPGAT